MTFNTDLGDVDSLTADTRSMTGTAPVLAVSEDVKGVAPSFASLDPDNSLPLGSATLTDLSDLNMNVAGLEEGVAYYFRVTASNYIGSGTTLLLSMSIDLVRLLLLDAFFLRSCVDASLLLSCQGAIIRVESALARGVASPNA